MNLTQKEIDYIFGDEAIKREEPIEVQEDRIKYPTIFGDKKEEKRYGKELFAKIDARLKESMGLPTPSHSIRIIDSSYIQPISSMHRDVVYNRDNALNLPIRNSTNANMMNRIEIPVGLNSNIKFTDRHLLSKTITNRSTLLKAVIEENVLLMKRFLLKNNISRKNIDTLNKKKFERQCKIFFGSPSLKVTDEMLNRFKDFVKTNDLTKDYVLFSEKTSFVLSANAVSNQVFKMSKAVAVSKIFQEILNDDKIKINSKMINMMKKLLKETENTIKPYSEIKKKYNKEAILTVGMMPYARLVEGMRYSRKTGIPLMENLFSKQAEKEYSEFVENVKETTDKQKEFTKENETYEPTLKLIQEITKDKNFSLSAPENINSLMMHKFNTVDEMLPFLQTNNDGHIDLKKLTIYTSPEKSEFDTIDTPKQDSGISKALTLNKEEMQFDEACL
jgi:hypothetical protein